MKALSTIGAVLAWIVGLLLTDGIRTKEKIR